MPDPYHHIIELLKTCTKLKHIGFTSREGIEKGMVMTVTHYLKELETVTLRGVDVRWWDSWYDIINTS